MSDWKDKSDFEINRKVAFICYPKAEEIPEQCDASVSNYTECQVVIATGKEGFKVDYCNNPLDAWSLILKFGIDILSPSTNGTSDWFAGFFDPHSIAGAEDIKVYNKNPLRAAMIVYLEMNGVKP